MTYGIVAAFAWGISTIAAANAARALGTYGAVLVSQVLGLLAIGILSLVLRPALGSVGGVAAIGLAGAGILGLAGWLLYYRALAGGPVGVVSAIGASYGGVTALLAVTLLGESIGGIGGLGVVLAVGGVALSAACAPKTEEPAAAARAGAGAPAAGAGSESPGRGPGTTGAPPVTGGGGSHRASRSRPGIPLALASSLTYGIGAFLLGRFSPGTGWLPATLVAYAASVATLVLALPFVGGRKALHGSVSGLAWASLAGLTEVTALLAFSRGGQVGQVAITAAISSLYPALALAGGIFMFRERLSRQQVLGVGCIAAGVVMLGLA
jgi:drug/metabolite transporter (DMT)-like permease